jgi:hypothetical protein
VRLTEDRLCVLLHFAFKPDVVYEIPIASIRSVQWRCGTLEIEYRTASGEAKALRVTAWRGPYGAPTKVIDCQALADEIRKSRD